MSLRDLLVTLRITDAMNVFELGSLKDVCWNFAWQSAKLLIADKVHIQEV